MNLYQELTNTLQQQAEYVDETGNLKKQIVIDKARQSDSLLINVLTSNKRLQQAFFKADGSFNKEAFINLLQYKNYLPDSHTNYDQEIGLAGGGQSDF